jgi:hypothetical protein
MPSSSSLCSMTPLPLHQPPPPEPVSKVKKWLRDVAVAVVQRMGPALRDAESGQTLGRALLIPWGGKIHVIGLKPEIPVRVQFLAQPRLTYWKQEVGFAAALPPAYSHEPTSAHGAGA